MSIGPGPQIFYICACHEVICGYLYLYHPLHMWCKGKKVHCSPGQEGETMVEPTTGYHVDTTSTWTFEDFNDQSSISAYHTCRSSYVVRKWLHWYPAGWVYLCNSPVTSPVNSKTEKWNMIM